MIDNQSITVHAFARYMLISLSVDEILLPRYVNLSTNFRDLPINVQITPSCLKHWNSFICVHVEANASYSLLQSMQLVWFYGISTIVGYLMPNDFYT